MQLDNVHKIDIKRSGRVKTGNKPCGPAHCRQPNKTGNEKNCWKCGREGHLTKDDCCPARKEKCRKCGIIGHFTKVCRSKDTHQNRVFSVNQRDANMKMLYNTVIERSRHPIPTIDDVLSELSCSTVLTKLDLTMGFHQLELKKGISRNVTTFTTHAGLFRYKRLMFGM